MMVSLFYTRFFVFPDLMHLQDCKGVIAVAIGCVLNRIIHECTSIGSTQAERLAWINDDLTKWYSGRRVSRLGVIKQSNICADSAAFPVLHGPSVKSAATRNALPWCVGLAVRLFSSDSLQDKSTRKLMSRFFQSSMCCTVPVYF